MLKHIRIIPLAAESLGVRSMCTYVETQDVRILLDAGVSLCPNRFGLPPHPQEFNAIIEARKRIAEAAEKAEIVTISHYHFDHHTPSFEDWFSQWAVLTETAKQVYQNKIVLMKNPRENINSSQRQRGWLFQKTGGSYAKSLAIADGKIFSFGNTTVRFSEPVPHGSENSELGWVLMTTIETNGERFTFAPDVQGPISRNTLDLIIKENPQLIIIGGPPSYLANFKVNESEILIALRNMAKIVQQVPVTLVEHHLLRDENWKEKTTEVYYEAYRSEHSLLTAAEFLGKPNNFLEATRKKLFTSQPPSEEFKRWMNENEQTRKHVRPRI
jgi:predicted metallo-beta-lactamase superfamily hydrolase